MVLASISRSLASCAPLLALSLGLGSGPLASQTLVFENAPKDFRGFRQSLLRDPRAMMDLHPVVLEAGGSHWGACLTQALSDERLLDWRLAQPRVIPADAGEDRQGFRQAFQGDPGPQWGLFDGQGRLKVRGNREPRASVLLEALLQAGVATPVQVLEAFCRDHPGQEEARSEALALRLEAAQAKMQRLPPGPAGEGLLDPAADERIWGDAARALDRFMETGEWRNGLGMPWAGALSIHARRSELMSAVIRRHGPAVEAQLRRMPGSGSLWALWRNLAQGPGDRRLGPLLDTLSPLPGTASAWPEAFVLESLEEACASGPAMGRDWERLAGLLGARWSSMRSTPLAEGERNAVAKLLAEQAWQECPARLLRAWVMAGDASRAEQVLGEACRWWPQGDLPRKGAEIARACGRPEWARRWSQGDWTPPEEGAPSGRVEDLPGSRPDGPGPLPGPEGRGRIQVLEAFLRTHPGHSEAALALAAERLAVSHRAAGDLGEAFPQGMLSAAEDRRIWGPTCQDLDRCFQSGEWAFDGGAWLASGTLLARGSSRMQALARRRLGEVEEALSRQPGNPGFWRIWLDLAGMVPERSIRSLLDRLAPTPGLGPWPPLEGLARLVQENRLRKAWKESLAILGPLWDSERAKGSPELEEAGGSLLGDQRWERFVGPLLEAALRSGEVALAERALEGFRQLHGSAGAARRAVPLAVSCGRVDLAGRWALSLRGEGAPGGKAAR